MTDIWFNSHLWQQEIIFKAEEHGLWTLLAFSPNTCGCSVVSLYDYLELHNKKNTGQNHIYIGANMVKTLSWLLIKPEYRQNIGWRGKDCRIQWVQKINLKKTSNKN